MIDLGTHGGDYSGSVAINNQGQIVGTSATSKGEMQALLLEKGVSMD